MDNYDPDPWDVSIVSLTRFGINAGQTGYYEDYPVVINSGRHTLTFICDALNEIDEFDETDNQAYYQYVWSPMEINSGDRMHFDSAPYYRSMAGPDRNVDGFRYTPHNSQWSVIGILPDDSGDEINLRLFSDYTGATNGFSNDIAASYVSGNKVDFIATDGRKAPEEIYPGVYAFHPSQYGYSIGLENASQGELAIEGGVYDSHQFDNLIVICKDFENSGTASELYVYLDILDDDLDLDIFLMTSGDGYPYKGRTEAIASSEHAGGGIDESFSVSLPYENEYYTLVITNESGNSGNYVLYTGDVCIHDGDTNNDGIVSSGDAQQTFRFSLSFEDPDYIESCAADCNNDGTISAGDAQEIFRKVLGYGTCYDD